MNAEHLEHQLLDRIHSWLMRAKIDLHRIGTCDKIADTFTKSSFWPTFQRIIGKMGMIEVKPSHRERIDEVLA